MGGGTEGCHFWSKKGQFFWFFGSQASRTSRGRAQNKRAAPQSCLCHMRSYPGAAYGVAQMISSKYPGYLIYRTTYLTPHTVPHIWHLTFGTSYLAPHFGTSPRHLTFRHHISKPILPILTRYFS